VDNFLNETVANPAWWFTAIFMALIVNVASTYLFNRVEKVLGKQRSIADERRAKYEEEIREAAKNPLWIAVESSFHVYRSLYVLALLNIFISFVIATGIYSVLVILFRSELRDPNTTLVLTISFLLLMGISIWLSRMVLTRIQTNEKRIGDIFKKLSDELAKKDSSETTAPNS
jgi:hypothetical protein